MPDAFEALGLPVEPIEPDPAFAARLRRQLEDSLLSTTIPRGGTDMTDIQVHETDDFTVTPAGDDVAWPPALTPYIAVRGARQAIAWYTDVFAARVRGGLYEGPDGTIGHAELALGDAVLMLSDPWLEGGVDAPEPGRTHSHSLHLQVDDVDGTVRRAAAEGAVIERQPEDQPYGRVATLLDPFGHRWMLNQPPRSASRVNHGDIGYVTLSTPDDERAKEFYGAVLGWRFTPGSVPRGWHDRGAHADDGARRRRRRGRGDAVLPRRRHRRRRRAGARCRRRGRGAAAPARTACSPSAATTKAPRSSSGNPPTDPQSGCRRSHPPIWLSSFPDSGNEDTQIGGTPAIGCGAHLARRPTPASRTSLRQVKRTTT